MFVNWWFGLAQIIKTENQSWIIYLFIFCGSDVLWIISNTET